MIDEISDPALTMFILISFNSTDADQLRRSTLFEKVYTGNRETLQSLKERYQNDCLIPLFSHSNEDPYQCEQTLYSLTVTVISLSLLITIPSKWLGEDSSEPVWLEESAMTRLKCLMTMKLIVRSKIILVSCFKY